MKINKKVNNIDICVGDVFRFDFKKLDGTPFEGSNLGRFLKEDNIDDMYIHIIFGADELNIVGMNLYYIKDDKISEITYDESPVFINYLFSKKEAIEKKDNIKELNFTLESLKNKENKEYKTEGNVKEISLGVKDKNGNEINYNDILKLDYQIIKNTNFFNDALQKILDDKKIEDLYVHIKDINNAGYSHVTSIEYHLYAVSSRGFENRYSDEENQEELEQYAKTKNLYDKPDVAIIKDFQNPGFIRRLYKANVITEIVGNSVKNELDITDVKKENPRPRIRF